MKHFRNSVKISWLGTDTSKKIVGVKHLFILAIVLSVLPRYTPLVTSISSYEPKSLLLVK